MKKIPTSRPPSRQAQGVQSLGRGSSRDQTPNWPLLTFFCACVLVPIWIVQYPPLQDYWNHVFKARVLAEYSNPVLHYSKSYWISLLPIPNMTTTFVLALLMKIAGPSVGGKLLLSIYALAFPLSTRYLVRCAKVPFIPLEYVGFAFVYNPCFWGGYLDFCLSATIAQFAIGYWIKTRDDLRPATAVNYLLLALLTFFTHLWVAVMLFAVTLGLALSESTRRKLLWLISALAVGVLFAVYASQSGERRVIEFGGATFTLSMLRNFFSFPKLDGDPVSRFQILAGATLIIIRLALFTGIAALVLRQRTRLAYIALAVLIGYFLLPSQIGRMYEPGQRTLVFLPAVLAAAVAVRPGRRFGGVLYGLIFASIVLPVLFTSSVWVRRDHELRVYHQAVLTIPAGASVLNVISFAPSEFSGISRLFGADTFKPERYFGAWHNIDKGGCYLNTFTTGVIQIRPGALPINPWFIMEPGFTWQEWLSRNTGRVRGVFEYVVVVGPCLKITGVLSPDYDVCWRSCGVEVMRRHATATGGSIFSQASNEASKQVQSY